MSKFSRAFSVVFIAFFFTVLAARFYVERPYYFSFATTINSEHAWLRDISLYFLSIRLDELSFDETRDLLQEILFPSNLGLPETWTLSNESVLLFCKAIDRKHFRSGIIFATAINASHNKDKEMLSLLNNFVDLADFFSEHNNTVDKNFIDSLDVSIRNIIEKREVGALTCPTQSSQ